MIIFDNWIISQGDSLLGRQYDNLSQTVLVTGVPDGYNWELLIQVKSNLNIIALEPMDSGVGAELRASDLGLPGPYDLQLRGTQGDVVQHTNVLYGVCVPKSLSGSAAWPTIPSAVEQALEQLEELNQHPPIPGNGGYWLVWDLERDEYVTSDLPLPDVSVGPPGQAATIKVGETVTGDPDAPAKVENTGTESAAVLRFIIPRGATGPTGATPDISVEVTGLPAGSEPTVEVSGTPEAPAIALGIPAGRQGDPGGKGDPGDPGHTPSITIGQVETLPAGSSVTASITGQTPNLVLNLGIPQGQQGDTGAGVPPTDGVPTDYLLSVGGWVSPPSGGGSTPTCQVWDVTVEEDVISYTIPVDDPTAYDYYIYQVSRPSGWSGNLLVKFVRSDKYGTSDFQLAKYATDGGIIIVRPIDGMPFSLGMNNSNTYAVNASSPNGAWYAPGANPDPASIIVRNSGGNVEAGTRIVLRGYKFESV